MPIKLFASALIAALLLTGTAFPVSQPPGQGAQSPQPQETLAAATTLTEAEAIAIALAHAELGEAEITELRACMDRDDRLPHWDIRWRGGDWEYDYDVDPETGAILEWDRDYEPEGRTQEPPVTQPPAAVSAYLTREEALDIALSHAGLTGDKISRLERSFDWDDGRPEWDIEFTCDGYEYSYEIHAETGAILDWEKEWDD